ncbi:hypothetical protein [Occallatibacter riparius]|uniref:Uncharacterized protein n=1 Tax=Occallatibacter riparius TaxID=1002689 RepID=A0A9J7BQA3_9BACT|nr:hypothetical protein [Occallatibacter riparius]UWZ84971.1 hypothetical protein MOP44_03285 [Occallatibacter riparius]
MLNRFLRRIARSNPRGDSELGGASAPAEIVELRLSEPRPWVGKYPEIPPPESELSLQMFVARFVCGDIHGEDTAAIALDLLEAGYDTPSLRRLAGETQVHCDRDAVELMERITKEAGFPVPFPVQQARMLVSRQIARLVIAGEREPWRAVGDLDSVWGWYSEVNNGDVNTIRRLGHDFVWDQEEQRFRPVVDADLLDSFARLAKLTDEECVAPGGMRS